MSADVRAHAKFAKVAKVLIASRGWMGSDELAQERQRESPHVLLVASLLCFGCGIIWAEGERGEVALPLDIDDLIHQRRVKYARIEYKKDWNPEKVLHLLCAFANDIDNWGCGYITLGVEEKNGMPVLPPKGIRKESVNAVNKELLNACNLIEWRYVPVVSHEVYDGVDILVLWCPASAVCPHKCPVVIAKNAKSERRTTFARPVRQSRPMPPKNRIRQCHLCCWNANIGCRQKMSTRLNGCA